MTRRLRRYVERKAETLARMFPQLEAGDLVGDAWTIYLTSDDDKEAFLSIRRHFNKVKMQTIREAGRFIPLEALDKYAYNPEDEMIAHIDLADELAELENPTSDWHHRTAKERIKRYLSDDA